MSHSKYPSPQVSVNFRAVQDLYNAIQVLRLTMIEDESIPLHIALYHEGKIGFCEGVLSTFMALEAMSYERMEAVVDRLYVLSQENSTEEYQRPYQLALEILADLPIPYEVGSDDTETNYNKYNANFNNALYSQFKEQLGINGINDDDASEIAVLLSNTAIALTQDAPLSDFLKNQVAQYKKHHFSFGAIAKTKAVTFLRLFAHPSEIKAFFHSKELPENEDTQDLLGSERVENTDEALYDEYTRLQSEYAETKEFEGAQVLLYKSWDIHAELQRRNFFDSEVR